MSWWTRCWKCSGKGIVIVPGRRLEPSELTPAQYADQLVNGGWHAELVRKECPRCGGTGRRK